MKNLVILLFVFVLPFGAFAQGEFEQAMGATLADYGKAGNDEELKAVEARFERIAMAEPSQWIPRYYIAMINCNMAFQNPDPAQKKLYTDKAQKFIDEAMNIASKESELYTLQGMIYLAVIGINPMNNGMVYSGKATGSFETAKALNPNNPRPYYMQGLTVLNTPVEYGGGKKAAIGLLTKANELFASFVPVSPLYPNWGKDDCAVRLEDCNKN
jgi:hypothetical protein